MSPILALTGLIALAAAQQIGKTPEVHPQLPTQLCTTRHGCVTQQTSVVLDALTHTIEDIKTGGSCQNSSGFPDQTICPNAQACAKNCAIEGINNYAQHGVTVSGNSMTLHQYLNINGTETSVSPRVYLLAPGGENYDLLKLLNQEFTFTVDVSNLPCGMNGALYLSEMSATGGRSALNPAGAAYGTGYCDAQCPKSAWINGVANINDNGACCNEMDIWEANEVSTQFTPHACNITGLYECSGAACGSNGVCDESGCGYNSYAYGNKTFYGLGDVVNTQHPFTVVTAFHTDDNTATGTLTNITRLYIQNNKIIQNAVVQVAGMAVNSIEDSFCEVVASSFQQRGGLAQMGEAIGRGMVLAMSVWNDPGAFMNWLDSGNAGPCNATQGNPALIEANDPTTSVTFSNIKIGDIGSTYSVGH
ncbi:family-7 endo-glucanase, partial [Aureobasidium melanogenum]